MATDAVTAATEMPRFRSHKTVWALKIKSVSYSGPNPGSAMLTFESSRHGDTLVSIIDRPQPQAGWYYVVYEDGYHSFSPGPQFEKGNQAVTDLYEKSARAAHEANRLLCQAIGDNSQPAWEHAPEWQRNSAKAGVAMIHRNPGTTPEQSHESWMRQKREDGWSYGPAKRPEVKEHPCMVPYEQLPIEQQLKDHMFGIVVRVALGL